LRDVFTEILAKRMSVKNLEPVFRGYELDEGKRLNIIAA
jgi:hypothetical protein